MGITIQDLRGKTMGGDTKRPVAGIKYIARHYSASATGDVWTFQEYWKSLGWGTGGYHEIILQDGTVQLCYDDDVLTNGVAGHNTPTYHICLVGLESLTEIQEKVFYERAHAAMKRFNLTHLGVLGHNEFTDNATACPGPIDMNIVRNILAGGDGNVTVPEYIIQEWNKQMVVAADILNVRKEPTTRSDILRQLTRGQVFHAQRVTLNGEIISGSANWLEVDGSGWVARALIAEASVDNEWREESGTVTVTLAMGINLRGPSSEDVTNPTSLGIIRRVDQGEKIDYNKVLIQKNGHAFVRKPQNDGFAWLAIGTTIDGKVTDYWVSGIRL